MYLHTTCRSHAGVVQGWSDTTLTGMHSGQFSVYSWGMEEGVRGVGGGGGVEEGRGEGGNGGGERVQGGGRRGGDRGEEVYTFSWRSGI